MGVEMRKGGEGEEISGRSGGWYKSSEFCKSTNIIS
jgi:hypothetical protein